MEYDQVGQLNTIRPNGVVYLTVWEGLKRTPPFRTSPNWRVIGNSGLYGMQLPDKYMRLFKENNQEVRFVLNDSGVIVSMRGE